MLPEVRRAVQGTGAERGRGDLRRSLCSQVHDRSFQGAGDSEQACGRCTACAVTGLGIRSGVVGS